MEKNWQIILCTLIKEYEEHTKYLFVYQNFENDKIKYSSKPSWLFNYLEEDNYSNAIFISVYKNECGQYKKLKVYAYDSIDEKINCLMY